MSDQQSDKKKNKKKIGDFFTKKSGKTNSSSGSKKNKPQKEELIIDEKKKKIYDETCFSFSLTGGPIHTDLLAVSALFTIEGRKGERVPLHCKWYNATDTQEFREIEGVNGAFYQPCADDVGTRICVQAFPAMGLDDFEGMPPFRECGPIILDQAIKEKAEQILQEKRGSFTLKVDKMEVKGKHDSLEYPLDCLIEVDLSEIKVFRLDERKQRINLAQAELSESYPTCVFIKKSNNIFNIHFNPDEHIRFSTTNNIQRDIIIMTIRMFCGQKVYNELNSKAMALLDSVEMSDRESIEPASNSENSKKEEQEEEKYNPNPDSKEEKGQTCDAILDESQKHQETEATPVLAKAVSQEIKLEEEQEFISKEKGNESKKGETENEAQLESGDIELEAPKQEEKEEPKNKAQAVDLGKQTIEKGAPKAEQHKESSRNPAKNSLKADLNIDVLLKLDQYKKDITKLNKEKENLISELEKEQEAKRVLSQELTKLKSLGEEERKFFKKLKEENEEMKQKHEIYMNEKVFFLQEINLFKAEKKMFESQVEEYQKKIQENEKNNKDREEKRNSLKNDIEELKKVLEVQTLNLVQSDKEISSLKEEVLKAKQLLYQSVIEKEQLENDNNYFKKKYESLVQEKTINVFEYTETQNQEVNKSQEKKTDDVEELKIDVYSFDMEDMQDIKEISAYEEEIKRLKRQIKNLEVTIETFKMVMEQDAKKRLESSKGKGNSIIGGFLNITTQIKEHMSNTTLSENEVYSMQRLANSLTETITDKDLALENQRKINKALIKKLKELEEKLRVARKNEK